jgi:hypothetical protein
MRISILLTSTKDTVNRKKQNGIIITGNILADFER